MVISSDTVIISLGGSTINPGEINLNFLRAFVSFVSEEVEKGKKFVIITGGGAPSREYISSLQKYGDFSQNALDRVGISATRLNASFIVELFGEKLAHSAVLLDENGLTEVTKPVVIGGGIKTGQSSDMCAVVMAETVGSREVINITNTTHVYTKDPAQFRDAEKIERISWSEYRALIPAEWKAGLSTPFDPVASERAEKLGLRVVITGANIENLKKYMQTGEIDGSIIE